MNTLSYFLSFYCRSALSLRRKRADQFRGYIWSLSTLPNQALRIMDVGGTRTYYHEMGNPPSWCTVHLINPGAGWLWYRRVWNKCEAMSADTLKHMEAGSYDVIFSNSTLAYVGGRKERAECAYHMQRITPRIFLQTPNKWFPLSWRTGVPFFQYLPDAWQARILTWTRVGRDARIPDYAAALAYVRQADDVDYAELMRLFPCAAIQREKVFGFTKSFIVLQGF